MQKAQDEKPASRDGAEERIYSFVTRSNPFILGGAALCAFVFAPPRFFLGVLLGGLIVTVNFALLFRTLKKALAPGNTQGYAPVLAKYYLRFMASAIIIFVLMATRIVHPIGLILGLSVVVVSIVAALVNELKFHSVKEAG
ncbi:MAG: ATP synthase subunit I [Deltaproteobacteria bacterium]|nr:ATP synthase subunit I [Deltaproteobacteria bacterium]